MKQNTLKEKLEIVKAEHEGKEIEYRHIDEWIVKKSSKGNFNFEVLTYRVKPEPKGCWVETTEGD